MTTTDKKIDELWELIEKMEIALFTTRRTDGTLVTRPMATQKRNPIADIWFVTDIETHKVDDLEADANVSLGYYDSGSREWVSVSGVVTISQDRAKIRELYQADWKIWFGEGSGEHDGGPNDPRLALLLVDSVSVRYMKSKYAKPRVLFELARAMVTRKDPELGREERLSASEF